MSAWLIQRTARPRRRLLVALLALAATACMQGAPLWDDIATERFFTAAMRAGTAVELSREKTDEIRSYLANVRFPSADDGVYVAAVQVAPPGSFLDPVEHERARAASPPDTRARDFPDIGLRARSEPPFFGPGGSTYGVAFTTGDGRWDVKVTLASRLTNQQPDPNFDPYAAARRLEALYRSRRQ